VDGLWATKSEGVGLSVRAISFQDFQRMWSWSTNVTDRQTDRQTDWQTGRHAISIPGYALVHRVVKVQVTFSLNLVYRKFQNHIMRKD